MSKRRRKYAPSEREAEFTIRSIFRILIFAFGALFALVTLSKFILAKHEPDDLLEPIKKQNDFTLALTRLPKWTKYSLGLFIILIPTTIVIVYIHQSTYTFVGHVLSIISASATFLSPVAAVITFVVFKFRRPHYHLVYDAPSRYQTLFRDGETVFYSPEQQYITYNIRLPRGMGWNAERSTRLVEQLIHSFAPLLFRIYADDHFIVWQVIDFLERDYVAIENAIRISYPEADVTISYPQDNLDPQSSSVYRLTLIYRAMSDFMFPFKYTSDVKDFDPLTAVVSAMNGLEADERMTYNIFVAGASRTAHEEGHERITTSTISPFDYFSGEGLQRIATLKTLNLDKVERYIPKDQQVFEEKLNNLLYQAVFMVEVNSPNKERILSLAQNVDSQLFGFARLPYNGLLWYTGVEDGETKEGRVPPDIESLILEFKTGRDDLKRGNAMDRIIKFTEDPKEEDARKATRLILEGREIALMWHLPDDGFAASRIEWLSSRTVPPPSAVTSGDGHGIYIGDGTSGGKFFPTFLPLEDRRSHVRIIGKTGVGKSTLMQRMIYQDIQAGYGVAVIDPHGSLVKRLLLDNCIPPARYNDVVILDLADPDNPPPLNPLRGGLDHVRVGQIVQSIERLYPTTKHYPRVSHYLRIAMMTLNADPSATLRDVVRLFNDSSYRERLLKLIENPDILMAWDEFERMKEGERKMISEPLRTRLSVFYSNDDLSPIVSHPDSLDFRALIGSKKIILISLKMDEERVPETERDLIGAFLLSRLQMSGMQDQSAEPYFLYIDEVQKFITTSLDLMFSEARKFGLSLTVAHQFLDQLPDVTQSAILGNVGASIVYACSPNDAHVYAPFTRPHFETDDLVNLDKYAAVAKIQYQGKTQPAFTLLSPFPFGYTESNQKTNTSGRFSPTYFPWLLPKRQQFLSSLPTAPVVIASNLQEETPITTDGDDDRIAETPEQHIRRLSRQNYTPTTKVEVRAWLKDRYNPKPKVDDQTQYIDSD